MGRKFRALDLFCGAGGAGKGLMDAGFEVFGVDIINQCRYPAWFLLSDAMAMDLSGYDFIWASPPCQAYSRASSWETKNRASRLIESVREKLENERPGGCWAIENVPQAPLRADLVLSGNQFGLGVIRKRHFEVSFSIRSPEIPVETGYGSVKNGDLETVAGGGSGVLIKDRWSKAMGIDWMTRRELAQAIPPAYSKFIGLQALEFLSRL